MNIQNRINRASIMGIGVCLVVFGVGLILNPEFVSSFGYKINFGRYHILIGVFIVIFGGWILKRMSKGS